MACGDRYKHLLVTARGLTPEKPYTEILGEAVPSPYDVAQWQAVTKAMVDRAWTAHEKLGAIEQARGRGYVKYNAFVEQQNALWKSWREHESFWFSSALDDVPALVRIGQDAACLLEEIDDAIVSYGEKPTTTPGKPSAEGSRWGWIAGLAVVGGVLYAGHRGWIGDGDG